MNGKVYFIGAGPGNAELITLKGYRILQQADVIIYDYYIDPVLVQKLKTKAHIISCESLYKASQYEKRSQDPEKVIRLLIKYALAGKLVARLKTGDPFIFGRTAGEIDALVEKNIEYEVIPGISAAQAAASYSGIPLTEHNYSEACIFVSGKDVADSQSSLINWEAAACQNTIAIYMTVSNLKAITQKLITSGKPHQTPAALVQNASLPNQKTIISTLENIPGEAKKQNITAPAILLTGETVRFEDTLNWLKKTRKILYTGMSLPPYRLSGTYYHLPLISVSPLKDFSAVDRALSSINKYHLVILLCPYSVNCFFERLLHCGSDARSLAGIQIAASGNETSSRLENFGIKPDLVIQAESASNFVEELGGRSLRGKQIFMPVNQMFGKDLIGELEKSRAVVDSPALFRCSRPSSLPDIDLTFFDKILFTSPMEVRNFITRYKSLPSGIKINWKGNDTLKELQRKKML